MRFHKITNGAVTQVFENGQCVEQKFTAGDPVEYETPDGTPIDTPDYQYQPFDMIPPQGIHIVTDESGDPTAFLDEDAAWAEYRRLIEESDDTLSNSELVDYSPAELEAEFVEIEGQWYRTADQYGTAYARIFSQPKIQ